MQTGDSCSHARGHGRLREVSRFCNFDTVRGPCPWTCRLLGNFRFQETGRPKAVNPGFAQLLHRAVPPRIDQSLDFQRFFCTDLLACFPLGQLSSSGLDAVLMRGGSHRPQPVSGFSNWFFNADASRNARPRHFRDEVCGGGPPPHSAIRTAIFRCSNGRPRRLPLRRLP